MTDHEVYIFNAGWKAFPDSRCYIRNKSNQTVEKATSPNIRNDRARGEEGLYLAKSAIVQMLVSDIPSEGFAAGELVEALQPITGGDDDWQLFRISGIQIAGGVITYALISSLE